MWVKLKKTGNRGFSLVELMVVVAIITILAGLAIPKFRNFQAKARQAEAKTNLSHIYTLQESFYADANAYWPFSDNNAAATADLSLTPAVFNDVTNCREDNALGFYISDCTRVRYVYESDTQDANSFTAQAEEINGTVAATRRVFPGCEIATADTWTIDEDKRLQATTGNEFSGMLAECQ